MTDEHEDSRSFRVVLCGTPEYAVPALRAIAAHPRLDLALVVTQPDRPAGRGRAVAAPPVKHVARELDIPTHQPHSLKTEEARAAIVECAPDVIVVAAYGLIFGSNTLSIPRKGCINLHASLLPKYRGAAPVTAAILEGEPETGVTLMQMERGLDTGPAIASRSIAISPRDTTHSLTARLADLGAEMIPSELIAFLDGALEPIPQPEHGASIVRQLVKVDGWIDWSRPAEHIERHVRAMWDWPRASTTLRGETLQVHRASVASMDEHPAAGRVQVRQGSLLVGCGEGALSLELVQVPGGKAVTAISLVSGRRLSDGEMLGATGAPPTLPPLVRCVETV